MKKFISEPPQVTNTFLDSLIFFFSLFGKLRVAFTVVSESAPPLPLRACLLLLDVLVVRTTRTFFPPRLFPLPPLPLPLVYRFDAVKFDTSFLSSRDFPKERERERVHTREAP